MAVSANRLELLQIADAVAREKVIDREIVLAAMADAIRQVFQDSAARQARIAAARRHAQAHYDLDRTVDATLAACAAVASPFPP